MSWAMGERDHRHIGYGVPAICDQPGCGKDIDRGMAYLCESYDDSQACGLFFCSDHLWILDEREGQFCDRCKANAEPFDPTPDVAEWVEHVLTDDSWTKFRETETGWTQQYRDRAAELGLQIPQTTPTKAAQS